MAVLVAPPAGVECGKGADSFESIPMPPAAEQVADSIAEQMDEFAACIQGGGRPEVAGEEGMAAVAVIEAIVRSAEGGGPVEPGSL